MSLVAYTVESGEESSTDDEMETGENIEMKKSENIKTAKLDDEVGAAEDKPLIFACLPAPKTQGNQVIKEEDDEFLHKSATENIKNEKATNKVQITIPSLREFQDVNSTYKNENRDDDAPYRRAATAEKKTSKLLNILPLAKSEQSFLKSSVIEEANIDKITKSQDIATTIKKLNTVETTVPKIDVKRSLIPDSVRLGRAGCNTEEQIGRILGMSKLALGKHKITTESESDDDDQADFFSLKTDDNSMQDIPEITLNEVTELLKTRTAKMTNKTLEYMNSGIDPPDGSKNMYANFTRNSTHISDLDNEVLQTLAGRKTAKRARRGEENIKIMDIHGSEVLPSREEWLRSALAASTDYQPTGTLNDEEPAAGTRRKHQITYLAHKAKANEAELQAMWAANRQTRRATQSKYGF